MSRTSLNGRLSSINPTDDICPVCKSNRYLNPNLTFLINPECYHTMCTSCVDRLFTSGPAPCPVAGCHKTLRKRGFHKAFFADLGIEREVDVRKRVATVFNRRQDEFETLQDYNDYLEMVESLVFDIVEGTPQEKRAAEDKLKAYLEENREEITENNKLEKEEREDLKTRFQDEADAAEKRRNAAARREQEEQRELQKSRNDVLDKLTYSDRDARHIAKEGQRAISKHLDKRRELTPNVDSNETRQKASGLTIRGLKRKEAPVAEKPYDPFGGLSLEPSRYVLQSNYANDWIENARNDPKHMVGGYSLQEYYARTIFEAFSGMGVFIEDEMASQNQAVSSAMDGVATGVNSGSDDVF